MTHRAFDFVFDFGATALTSGEPPHLHVVVGPAQAKLLLRQLADTVHRFERFIGVIATDGEDEPAAGADASRPSP